MKPNEDEDLKKALFYIGRYVDNNILKTGEWLTFSVNLMKKSPGIVNFTSPSLTEGIANTYEVKDEANVVAINEFLYA